MTHLIEIQGIQKLIELPVLAHLIELNIVLLETVESELRLIVDKDFERLRVGDMSMTPERKYVNHIRWP